MTSDTGEASSGPLTVSVVIPTFNRAASLPAAIDSALGQTHPVVEIVVVDDGSSDDTPALLDAYDDRIVVRRQSNAGVAAARNTGISAATGTVVMFLDSDDLLLPNAAALHVSGLQRSASAVASMGDLTLVSPSGAEASLIDERKLRPTMEEGIWHNVQDVVATRFLFSNQTVAVRRNVINRIGGFDPDLWVMEDFDFALRLSAEGPWAFTSQPVAVRHEGTEGSLTALATSQQERLDQTIDSICTRALAVGALSSPRARRAIARMRRRARRNASDPSSAARVVALLDEEVGERVYRNTPLFPRAQIAPFAAIGGADLT